MVLFLCVLVVPRWWPWFGLSSLQLWRRGREDSENDCFLGCNAGLVSPIQAMSVTVECVCAFECVPGEVLARASLWSVCGCVCLCVYVCTCVWKGEGGSQGRTVECVCVDRGGVSQDHCIFAKPTIP